MDGGDRPRDRDDGIPPFYSFQNPYFVPALASPAMAVGIPVAMAASPSTIAAVVGVAVLGSAAVLCLAIAAAILRYRLYDLDRVVSRTIAYGC